jgi:hypothetical protein
MDWNATCKKIILDWIEKLERVNSFAADWRELVDGGDQDDLCSEHKIFLIWHRSIYLACALRKFVNKVTNKARWTWLLCIEHAIGLMNNIGIKLTLIGDHWQGGTNNWHTAQRMLFLSHLPQRVGCLHFLSRIRMQLMLSRSMG